MERGIVKSFDIKQGQGIIERQDGGAVMVESADIIPSEETAYSSIENASEGLPIGAEVSFDIIEGAEGYQAKNVVEL